MNRNVGVKQARLWQREVARAAKGGVPHSDEMLDAMADHLSQFDGIEVALGLSLEEVASQMKRGFLHNMLLSARDGKRRDAIG